MKNIFARIALSLGIAALSPAVAMAQETSGYTIKEVCTNPDLVALRKKLWDYVSKQDKVEIYIAYLDACGDSALTAEFTILAREIVITRTMNYAVMPTYQYTFSRISDRRINAYYIS